jgi:hypothetical protein
MWIQRAMLGAVLALLGSACMSGYDTRIPPSQSPYDAVAPAQLAVLTESRAQRVRGEWAPAPAAQEPAPQRAGLDSAGHLAAGGATCGAGPVR